MRALLPLLALLLGAAPPDAIPPARLSADVKVLASPAFEGRAPGTPGEERTVAWLIAQLKAAGVEPGGPQGKWTQDVPLVRTGLVAGTVTAGTAEWTQARQVYLSTVRPDPLVRLDKLPMVFVGHGVYAPERGWDDFKGADLTGKVAVFLVNDPDFAAAPGEPVAGRFGGRRMTYYGRWTYKFEEAARRGAAAALIVHDTPGAGYGWATVTAPAGENYDVVRTPDDRRVALQGWIEGEAAAALFARAGLDLAAERVRARRADFRPEELKGQGFSATLAVAVGRSVSRNVLARLPGRTRPDEAVMIGAHWDAYGRGPDGAIRPGANDDALGVAATLALARAFARGPRPERSLVFAFWTGEERGLLGSEHYAQHPVVPPALTVANLTFDILNTAGRSHDVMLVGANEEGGQNDLEDRLAAAARAQGRTVTPEALPERGLFYRADHFSLARRGVPTLLLMAISGAPDLVTGGRPAGQAWLDGYMRCYHQACDAWDAGWDLSGAAEDAALFLTIARDLANGRDWPEWHAGSEFRAIRSAARRAADSPRTAVGGKALSHE